MLKIAIVDDHLLFRRSLTLLINSFERMKVTIEAENGKEFLSKAAQNVPDIVLLDLDMPVMNGYETCRSLKKSYPDTKVLVVSQLSSKESVYRMMEMGAHGYFTKNSNPEQLEHALQSVVEEGLYFATELGAVLKEALLWEKINPLTGKHSKDLLSDRELQILRMVCAEMKSKEIAEKLFINVRTVESHRKHIIEKTNSKNFLGAILYVLKHKLVSIDDFQLRF